MSWLMATACRTRCAQSPAAALCRRRAAGSGGAARQRSAASGGCKLPPPACQLTLAPHLPQVFIGGKHVGGCDDTMAAYSNGQLKQMLAGAGVSANL